MASNRKIYQEVEKSIHLGRELALNVARQAGTTVVVSTPQGIKHLSPDEAASIKTR